jgi:hypothetical protein
MVEINNMEPRDRNRGPTQSNDLPSAMSLVKSTDLLMYGIFCHLQLSLFSAYC